MRKVNCYAAFDRSAELKPFEYEMPDLPADCVDVKVEYCGICHSDYSLISGEWGPQKYPRVPGHEIVGRVVATGSAVKGLKEGDRVGLGWTSESCQSCEYCISGNHNLCLTHNSLIADSFGGFANYVRAQYQWLIKMPEGVNPATAGPLFCGGITVFTPLLRSNLRPTQSCGVVGVGGLGHLAVQFADKWGCEVVAFSSQENKKAEVLEMGADLFVNSKDDKSISSVKNSLDLIIVTANASLNWNAYISALKPEGKIIVVGAVLEPIPVAAFSLIRGQKSIAGSNIGNPADMAEMLKFCARHKIEPITETFKIADCNSAMKKMLAGDIRYRAVLEVDL